MKRLSLILLLIILTACVSSPAPTTLSPKNETETPTSTAIITETAEPTSTVTPDPLADAPKGYTNFDKDMGAWTRIDAESRKTIFWDAERKEDVSLMFEGNLWDLGPELEGNKIEYGSIKYTDSDSMNLNLYISTAIINWNKLTVTHNENTDPLGTRNWTLIFQNFLWQEMVRRGLIKDPIDFKDEIWYSQDGYTINYETKEGPQLLRLNTDHSITVHIRADFDALKADQTNNNFSEVVGSANLGSPVMRYMLKISSDDRGNTFVEIAPNIVDALEWSDATFIELALIGEANAICNPDTPVMNPRDMSLSTNLAMNHDAFPYFIFTRAK